MPLSSAEETLLTANGGRLDGDYVMDELKKRTGAGERTIREAKTRLGVKSVLTGKHKYDWVLDAAPPIADPAVQQALQRVAGGPTIQ